MYNGATGASLPHAPFLSCHAAPTRGAQGRCKASCCGLRMGHSPAGRLPCAFIHPCVDDLSWSFGGDQRGLPEVRRLQQKAQQAGDHSRLSEQARHLVAAKAPPRAAACKWQLEAAAAHVGGQRRQQA